ncbi:MAG: hypothetical protein ACE5E1_05070 [Phycisphaerae bacterium]
MRDTHEPFVFAQRREDRASLPDWRTLGERVRRAAFVATVTHLSQGEDLEQRQAMLETSRGQSGG